MSMSYNGLYLARYLKKWYQNALDLILIYIIYQNVSQSEYKQLHSDISCGVPFWDRYFLHRTQSRLILVVFQDAPR